jgi:flavin reductase (DIM6/NTAB) family NADH-FMN oxidoreductase RutF
MKKQLGPSDTFFPVPAALVVSGIEGELNIITVAWIGIVGSTPPTVGISLKKTRYSLEIIRKSKEFTVNIPSADCFKETDYCGLVTGRNRNKFDDIGFTPGKSSRINTPIIRECPYNMECRVTQEIVLGGWVLILGEIVETHIDVDKVNPSNRAKIDIPKVNPLVYCAEVREYWALGKRLGRGFHAGKEILQRTGGRVQTAPNSG